MEEIFSVRDYRAKEMFRVDDAIVDKYAKKIGITALNVYLYLCRHADRHQESFPSQEYLSKKIGVSKRTIIRAIKTLEEWNLISIKREWRQGTQKTNNTYVLVDKIHWKKEAGDKNVTSKAGDKSDQKQVTNRAEAGDTTDTLRYHIQKDTHIGRKPASQEIEIIEVPLKEEKKSEAKAERIAELGYDSSLVKPTLKEAQTRFGVRFANPIVQEGHIKAMLITGFSEKEILDEFERLLGIKFWADAGVDFGSVRNNIGKARKSNIKTPVSDKYAKYA